MTPDIERGIDGDDGREELRSLLRQWHVPEPPPDIEEELRRTFRQRRSRRRHLVWLPLAAGLTMLLVWQLGRPRPPVPPAPAAAAAPAARSTLPSAATEEPERSLRVTTAPPPRAPRHPPSAPVAVEPEVVFEPGQAEMLVAFTRRLGSVGEAVPGPIPRATSLSRDAARARTLPAPQGAAPQYRGESETRVGEWTLVHPHPFTGR